MGSISKAFLILCLSLVILSVITSSQGAKLLPEVAKDEMNGNNNIEPQAGAGKHLVKSLGKIFKAGKAIYCNRCETCKGLCGYCCKSV